VNFLSYIGQRIVDFLRYDIPKMIKDSVYGLLEIVGIMIGHILIGIAKVLTVFKRLYSGLSVNSKTRKLLFIMVFSAGLSGIIGCLFRYDMITLAISVIVMVVAIVGNLWFDYEEFRERIKKQMVTEKIKEKLNEEGITEEDIKTAIELDELDKALREMEIA